MSASPRKKLDDLEAAVVARYEALPTPERLSKVLAALAAGDTEHAERLRSTCPRLTYVAQDFDFTQRVTFAASAAMIAAIDLRYVAGKIIMLHTLAEYLGALLNQHSDGAWMAFLEGVEFAEHRAKRRPRRRRGDDPELEAAMDAEVAKAEKATADTAGLLREIAGAAAEDFHGILRGFDRFARARLGVSGDEALRAWVGPFIGVEMAFMLLKHHDAPPDAKAERKMFDSLEVSWLRHVEGRDDVQLPRYDEDDDQQEKGGDAEPPPPVAPPGGAGAAG